MKTLLKDQKKFFSYISSSFDTEDTSEGVSTSGIELKSTIQKKDFTFKNVFNPDTDCISQEDMFAFLEKNKEQTSYTSYFFLGKNKAGKRLVFGAYFDGGEWRLSLFELEDGHVWNASFEREVVVPKHVPENSETPRDLESLAPMTLKLAIQTCKDAGLEVARLVTTREVL